MEDELLNEISEIIWKTKGLRSQDEIMLVAATVSASKKILTLIRKRESELVDACEGLILHVKCHQGKYGTHGKWLEEAEIAISKFRKEDQQLKEVGE